MLGTCLVLDVAAVGESDVVAGLTRIRYGQNGTVIPLSNDLNLNSCIKKTPIINGPKKYK
jgi:hypothetical protein